MSFVQKHLNAEEQIQDPIALASRVQHSVNGHLRKATRILHLMKCFGNSKAASKDLSLIGHSVTRNGIKVVPSTSNKP